MGNELTPSKEFKIRTSDVDMNVFDHFTDEEIERMKKWLEWTPEKSNKERRHRWNERNRYRLLFQFLLETGGRVSEVLSLRYGDVSIEKNVIIMKTLKQKKRDPRRVIPIHPTLKDSYLNYISNVTVRDRMRSNERIFPMTRSAVDQFFKRMQGELGFSIHAHRFRHTFAVKALLNGVPLNKLQLWLGHSNVWTTNTYTKTLGTDSQGYMDRIKF